MRCSTPEELATLAWEQDEPIAFKASALIEMFDAMYAAGNYDMADEFFAIVAPWINAELAKTDTLERYVLEDFLPRRAGIIRVQSPAQRLDEIRKDVEQKLCEQ